MKIEELQQLAFEMITAASDARVQYQKAIDSAKESKFDEAKEYMKSGSQKLSEGSQKHFAVIQEEASGTEQPNSVLFMHAEDQLIMTEIMRDNANQFIDLYQRIEK